ncbi:Transient receptor potential cation channel subfamily M member 2 (Estrogen-responsive element-associated gene 1 protein) (Long transient receptor potential channel 2) (LTrpC-2) (LTrpC2) (Transient receptor potential channel 7) (TrpC7) (Transient receptor potential melastatin 2) [Durusdinium trenchii]|uniref:Uncharacterized protein n=1 Tax=Durusdinium trenchii TaxID=1381693 RepID=A0ABP0SEU7_9DINO
MWCPFHRRFPLRAFRSIRWAAEVWDLEAPRLLLSIVGGAGEMNLDPAVEAHFCEELVGAAKQTHGWVITGGTDSGVMDLVGRAMHRHDARRTVPCIGVTPFGALKDAWRATLDPVESFPDAGVVEAPVKTDSGQLAGLQEHHTHVVLVDGGKRGQDAFGTEVDMREALERYVATAVMRGKRSRSFCFEHDTPTTSTRSSNGSHHERVLRVMIVVNGGPVSFTLMDKAIQNGCPVVVCNNSGRAADFIASLKLGVLTDYEEAWKKHMTAPPDVKSGLKGVRCGVEALERIVRSSCVSVYTTNDRLEDVILEALRGQQVAQDHEGQELHSSLERLLELAVQWNCEKHYVTIARRLVATCGFPKAARFILQHFCNDWSEKEVETAPLMRWLVATFIDSLKRLDLNELSPGSIRWNKAEMQLQTFEVSSLAHLFIWLVENMAPESVTDVLWLCLDYPAHGALAAASVCRHAAELYQLQGSYGETIVGNRLFKRANRFEAMAIRLLEGLDRVDPLEYVFRCSWRWGNHHLISLAHHLECKEFVSQHFYNSAVDLLWVTPTPFAVFAFDKDDQRRQANKVMEPYPEIFLRLFQQLFNPSSSRHQLSLRDLSSIPRVKALTHGGSRVTFVLLYSHFVLFSTGYEAWLLSLVLFVWGISLSLIEALQLQAKGSIGQYMNIWNGLDVLLIFTLLIGLILWWCLVPWALSEQTVNSVHALNLLPCYVRLLQIFELSEYFGTLLFTVFGMAQDTTQFLVLLGIISLGFSCSLTPILYPTHQARWSQGRRAISSEGDELSGVTWGFWAIFGDVNLEGTEENLPWSLKICVSFLQYLLSLASNVLLVNLLIAMLPLGMTPMSGRLSRSEMFTSCRVMCDFDLRPEALHHLVANKDSSKREWAFNRVDAVLEFASPEAHILPPPLDILVSLASEGCNRI